MVPATEVARFRCFDLPSSSCLSPSPLLDSALNKMRSALNDAVVQRTLHPPKITQISSAGLSTAGSSSASSADRGGASSVVPRLQTQVSTAPSSSSTQQGWKQRERKGKAPFSAAPAANARVPGRCPPDGDPPLLRVGGLPVSALEALVDSWSRILGAVRPEGRIPHPLQGFSSPCSHLSIVSDISSRFSLVTGLVPGGRGDVVHGCLGNHPRSGPGFSSHLFLVEKIAVAWRPVFALSLPNEFVLQPPFMMESVVSVLQSV